MYMYIIVVQDYVFGAARLSTSVSAESPAPIPHATINRLGPKTRLTTAYAVPAIATYRNNNSNGKSNDTFTFFQLKSPSVHHINTSLQIRFGSFSKFLPIVHMNILEPRFGFRTQNLV